ncbi:LytR/AlgR family response regulator transcription factor [Anaerostipes sp.]|uniref:LytR/AlgR family response regulator transcription factor n=1 Tax=Anaerostipes sp. TaxID=1872530 RepID=UPI0025B88A1C|nr:LytTR family DNA-binding domain-containing protein [Anaerostipes sp.]MBS7008330.1 response regulator transcription factor [Anaerostipes sp.]
MFSICFCDNSYTTIKKYTELFQSMAVRHQIPVSIRAFSSGKDLLTYLENPNHFFDLYFIDTELKGISGIDTALRLRDFDPNGLVIFLGIRPEYAGDCFAALPFNYIIKSRLNYTRGESAFLSAYSIFKQRKQPFIVCRNRSAYQCIRLSDISHFEALGRLAVVHFNSRTFEFYSKLNIIEQAVKNRGFIRVHRSYIVNLSYISDADKENIYLTDNESPIPIGQVYLKQVRRETFPFFSLNASRLSAK